MQRNSGTIEHRKKVSCHPALFSSTNTVSNGNINYNCTSGTPPFTIDLSKGSASSYNPRQLTSGSNSLNYNLYRDATGLEIWGDGTGSTFQNSTPNNLVGNLTIYGIIPSRQNVSVGNYTDSITATINY